MKYKVIFRSIKRNQFYVHTVGQGYAWVGHSSMRVGDTGKHLEPTPGRHVFIPDSIDVEVLEINSRNPSNGILPNETPRPSTIYLGTDHQPT